MARGATRDDSMRSLSGHALAFLGLPANTPLPNGRKGKAKMRKLHQKVALNKPYHEGDRALPLIRALDMDGIVANAPIPLALLETAIFGPRES